MNNVLLDTNVWVDFFANRDPFFEPAKRILKHKDTKLYVTSITLPTIHYLLVKSAGKDLIVDILCKIIRLAEVLPTTTKDVKDALESDFGDFEDALQNFTAKNNGVGIIVTRNPKDFATSELEVLSPSEFVGKYIKR